MQTLYANHAPAPGYCEQEKNFLLATYRRVKGPGSSPADTLQGIVTNAFMVLDLDLTDEMPVVLAEVEAEPRMTLHRDQPSGCGAA